MKICFILPVYNLTARPARSPLLARSFVDGFEPRAVDFHLTGIVDSTHPASPIRLTLTMQTNIWP